MSDQRRIVPSETPRAWAACEVERPSGLALICSMGAFQRGLCRVRESRTGFAQPRSGEDAVCAVECDDGGQMRLRLYHHHDGARVAYRETGTGPAITLLHSLGLSHREWEPIVAPLSARFRVVLPDLPLHGDSEDRPRHPYTPEWLADVIAGFCREVAGPRPLLAGHDIGAELALRAVTTGRLEPARLVLMSNRLHRRDEFAGQARTVAGHDAPGRPAGARSGSLARRHAHVPPRCR